MTSSTLASEYVVDTMALVLQIEKRKMSQTAKNIFSAMESGNTVIHVPAMVFAEILYHSEKGRIKCSLADIADYSSFELCENDLVSLFIIGGEIRLAPLAGQIDKRLTEAVKLGFKKALIPKLGLPKIPRIEVVAVEKVDSQDIARIK